MWGQGVGRQIRVLTFLFLFYSALVLTQSKIWLIFLNGLDIAITMTETSFSPNPKPVCILTLHFDMFFISQIPIIRRLHQHRPRTEPCRAPVATFSQADIKQPPLSTATEAQVHPSQLSLCLHFFIFPTRTSCEALLKLLLKEKPSILTVFL